MLAGVLASLGYAGGVLIDKYELSKRHFPLRLYLPLLFAMLAFVTGVIMVLKPSTISISEDAGQGSYVVAFIAMIALATTWNIYYYRGLKRETVQQFDLILLIEPLATVAMASIFFVQERNAVRLLLALIAAIMLIIAHVRRSRVVFNTFARGLLIAVFLISLEVLVIRVLLDVYSPVLLYFLRTLALTVAFLGIYRPSFKHLSLADFSITFVVALFGVLQMVSRFFGYAFGGVVLTTLLLLLGPVIVESISLFFLKERMTHKTALAFMVIILCVYYASII